MTVFGTSERDGQSRLLNATRSPLIFEIVSRKCAMVNEPRENSCSGSVRCFPAVIFDGIFYRLHILIAVKHQSSRRRLARVAPPSIPDDAATLTGDAHPSAPTANNATSATNNRSVVRFVAGRQFAIGQNIIGVHTHHGGPVLCDVFATIDEDFDFVVICLR